MQGYVKLYRSLRNWEWYNDTNVKAVFLHLLLSANHTPTKYKGYDINTGELPTGRHALSRDLGLSEQQIRTALNKLKSTGEITIRNTPKFSIVSISNWFEFQGSNQQDNQQSTSNQPAINQQSTTLKNGRMEKGENEKKKQVKRFAPPTQDEVLEYMKEKGLVNGVAVREAEKFINYYESIGWVVGKNKPMKNWKGSAGGWVSRMNENDQGEKKQEFYR